MKRIKTFETFNWPYKDDVEEITRKEEKRKKKELDDIVDEEDIAKVEKEKEVNTDTSEEELGLH